MPTKHLIKIDNAKLLLAEYKKSKKKILKDDYHNKPTLPNCETFERAAFDKVLGQTGCTGLRIYFGMDEELNVKLVVVGVNDKNEDMLDKLPQVASDSDMRTLASASSDDEDPIIEDGLRCPDNCPSASVIFP